MGKKFALNVLYTVGIVIAMITAYWGYGHKQYACLIAAVFVLVVFVTLKIKLLKEIRNSQRP